MIKLSLVVKNTGTLVNKNNDEYISAPHMIAEIKYNIWGIVGVIPIFGKHITIITTERVRCDIYPKLNLLLIWNVMNMIGTL